MRREIGPRQICVQHFPRGVVLNDQRDFRGVRATRPSGQCPQISSVVSSNCLGGPVRRESANAEINDPLKSKKRRLPDPGPVPGPLEKTGAAAIHRPGDAATPQIPAIFASGTWPSTLSEASWDPFESKTITWFLVGSDSTGTQFRMRPPSTLNRPTRGWESLFRARRLPVTEGGNRKPHSKSNVSSIAHM